MKAPAEPFHHLALPLRRKPVLTPKDHQTRMVENRDQGVDLFSAKFILQINAMQKHSARAPCWLESNTWGQGQIGG